MPFCSFVIKAVHGSIEDSGCQQSAFHGPCRLSRMKHGFNGSQQVFEMSVRMAVFQTVPDRNNAALIPESDGCCELITDPI